MTILSGDIKLVTSEVMSDIDEGGGGPTANAIADGTSNAVFPDISELDRAGGRVNLRKVFAHVQTANTDTYLGGNVIVADGPDDANVSVTIFKANDTFDTRSDAQNRIESYLTKGSEINGFLLEDHIAGQKSLRIFQRTGSDTPAVGETLYLGNKTSGQAQYVRVTAVASAEQTFTYLLNTAYVDYQAQVTTCGLSDSLLYDFTGSPPSRVFAGGTNGTRIYDTVVADAGSYYGVTTTTAAVDIGDIAAPVVSVYTKLVPSAQTETALTDMSAGGSSQAVIAAANGTVSYTTSNALGAASNLYLGHPMTPGTLAIAYPGGSMSDSGGELLDGSTVVGTVDYAAGQIVFAAGAPTYSNTKTISFTPAGAPVRIADTLGLAVSLETRAYNYTQTILPAPAPGTLEVSFFAQGNWYTLRDNGNGKLKGGDSAYGVGTISYATGTVSVTLGALPDVGSAVMFAWGGQANYFNRSGNAPDPIEVSFTLANPGITPGSLTITWNDGTARTLTDDGAGHLTGSGTGEVIYSTGAVTFTPAALPLGSQTYAVSYTFGSPDTTRVSGPPREGDGTLYFNLGKTGILPGSVEISWPVEVQDYAPISNTPADMLYVASVANRALD